MLGQIGNTFLIYVRAAKRNILATRNSLICEFVLQLGLTQILLETNKATPLTLGLVMIAYCFGYLALNAWSALKILKVHTSTVQDGLAS